MNISTQPTSFKTFLVANGTPTIPQLDSKAICDIFGTIGIGIGTNTDLKSF